MYGGSGNILMFTNDVIITSIDDKETNYQSGDGLSCLIQLGNGDIMIVNCGDVSSCILFTVNKPDVITYLDNRNEDEINFDFDVIVNSI